MKTVTEWFRKICGLAALLMSTAALSALAAPAEVVINNGKLLGSSNENIAVFKGIPYASPPVGSYRWRAPQPAANWSGTRLATQFSPQCEQLPYPEASMFTRPSMPASEDCLYLNVWSANMGGEAPQAVMVWFHGGGLTRGSGANPVYDGSALARKGVVVVTVNYRLGPFGYMAHPALSREAEQLGEPPSSGNYGTLDQVAALRWVQDNIAQFGGDRSRVTIFGESAGSWSVNHMTATPLAAGLFHRAIGQSGAKFDPMPELAKDFAELPSAQTQGARFAKHLGAKDLAALRALPASAITAGFETFNVQRFAQPNVDGYVFPDHIANIFASGKHNRVDLIIGSNADEGTNLMPPPKDAQAVHAFFDNTAGTQAQQLKAAYELEKDHRSAYYGMFRDLVFTWNMRQWANYASQYKDNTYLYYFTYVPPAPMNGRLGAYHAAEIRYAFDNADVTFGEGQATDVERQVGDVMSDYWVSFAKTGKPRAANGDRWPQYDAKKQRYMQIGHQAEAQKGGWLNRELALIGELVSGMWARRENEAL